MHRIYKKPIEKWGSAAKRNNTTVESLNAQWTKHVEVSNHCLFTRGSISDPTGLKTMSYDRDDLICLGNRLN